jgi:hypothetical protein
MDDRPSRYADTNSDIHANCYCNSYGNSRSECNPNSYCYCNSHCHSDGHSYSDGNALTRTYFHPTAYTYAKVQPATETPPYSATASVADHKRWNALS